MNDSDHDAWAERLTVRVLGASGGIGPGLATTAFLIDDSVLIDAGTGVGALTADEMARIRHIFVTHAHLDHIVGIPLLADALFGQHTAPITVHARPETLAALQTHVFNWQIWPDFTRLPDAVQPVLRFAPFAPGERRRVAGIEFAAFAVHHAVPAQGYAIRSAHAAIAFSGDTTTNQSFWAGLNALDRLDLLFVECAYAAQDEALARLARHYTPELLARDLDRLRHRPRLAITHLKPHDADLILRECAEHLPGWALIGAESGQVFEL